jgi:hypothetical protein
MDSSVAGTLERLRSQPTRSVKDFLTIPEIDAANISSLTTTSQVMDAQRAMTARWLYRRTNEIVIAAADAWAGTRTPPTFIKHADILTASEFLWGPLLGSFIRAVEKNPENDDAWQSLFGRLLSDPFRYTQAPVSE